MMRRCLILRCPHDPLGRCIGRIILVGRRSCRGPRIDRGIRSLLGGCADPRQAEPTRHLGDQLQVTHLRQSSGRAGVRWTEDGGQAALRGTRQRTRTERLPGRDGAQPATDPVGECALGETQPAALPSQLVTRYHPWRLPAQFCAGEGLSTPTSAGGPAGVLHPGRPGGSARIGAFMLDGTASFGALLPTSRGGDGTRMPSLLIGDGPVEAPTGRRWVVLRRGVPSTTQALDP